MSPIRSTVGSEVGFETGCVRRGRVTTQTLKKCWASVIMEHMRFDDLGYLSAFW